MTKKVQLINILPKGCLPVVCLFFIIFCVSIYFTFPKVKRNFVVWSNKNFGKSTLVIQYSANGQIIHWWNLEKASVENEEKSDGIFFLDEKGNAVHLSGNYTYIQYRDWLFVKNKYLNK